MTFPASDEPIRLIRSADIGLVSNTPKGRGIFALADIPSGTVVEMCPALVLSMAENEQHIQKTLLHHYTYTWPVRGEDGKLRQTQAVILGLGSMFNHARYPNVGYTRDLHAMTVSYVTLRGIKSGEELCISYGERLTFEPAQEHKHEQELASEDLDAADVLGRIEI